MALIVTIQDVSEAMAKMNTAYQLVAALASRVSGAGKLTPQLVDRVTALKAQVDKLNDDYSPWSFGVNFPIWLAQATTYTATASALAGDLASVLGEKNPVPKPPTPPLPWWGWLLLSATAVGLLWAYRR